MSNYPGSIDVNLTVIDNQTPVKAAIFNQLASAIIAIEATLGTSPNGIYGSTGARIGNLETIVGNLQIIDLNQDLGGTLAAPLVIGLYGNPISSETLGSAQDGYVLTWNGIAWIPLSLPQQLMLHEISITSTTYAVDSGSHPDTIILTDSTSNTITITLPAPVAGRTIFIKDRAGKAATHNIIILPHTIEKIDGASSLVFSHNYSGVMLTAGGINWHIVSAYSSTIIF